MPNFKYSVRDKQGKLVTGMMEADSETAIANHFTAMGYIPISIQEVSPPKEIKLFKGAGKVKLEELNLFTRQLVTLQRAGIPLLASLDALKEQVQNPTFKKVIQQVISDVEGGSALSQALERNPSVFNKLYTSMVRAGESSGQLDALLERLAQLGEDELVMHSRIKSATRYPIIVISTLVIAFMLIVGFVLPKFSSLYSSLNVALPLPTKILLAISEYVRSYWWLIILFFIGVYIAFKRLLTIPVIRVFWDRLKLKMYIFGPLNLKISMSRFTRVTAVLLKSGLPVLHVLDLVKGTVGNVIIQGAIDQIKKGVTEGKGLSDPMRDTKLFPPMVIQMVASGEVTGKIDDLLLRIADFYDSQVDYTLKNLTSLIEPILIFVLGGMILTIALAIFLPMWNMMQVFKGG